MSEIVKCGECRFWEKANEHAWGICTQPSIASYIEVDPEPLTSPKFGCILAERKAKEQA